MKRRHCMGVLNLLLTALATGDLYAAAAAAAAPPDFKPSAGAWVGRSGAVANQDRSWERFHCDGKPGAMQLVHVTSANNGATWSEPRTLRDLPGEGWGGEAALPALDGEMHLFVTRRRQVGEGKVPGVNVMYDIWHFKSSDKRTKWPDPKPVFEGYVGAMSNALRLASGRIVVPFGMLIGGRPAAPPNGRHELTCIYSDDDGKTWTMSPARLTSPVPENYNGSGEGACEPTIVQLKDGRVWMLMRTAAGFLYESWSDDGSKWSDTKPSRFHASHGPPYLIRLKDDRIALFWNNCELPPRFEGAGVYGGRDALHAAIGDAEAKHFVGFREIYLDPKRNDSPPRSGDRGTAYPDALLASDGRIGVASGQGGRAALMLVDPAWLYETSRASDFSDGIANWSVYKGFGKAAGWWRDRVQGAQLVDHPDQNGKKVLHVRRPDEKDPDGATWNFPMGRSGSLVTRIMAKEGGRGGNITLSERFFDPSDATCDAKALFLLPLSDLKPGAWHEVALKWDVAARKCVVAIDGKESTSLTMAHDTPTGVAYVRFRSTASEVDPAGFLIESVRVDVKP